MRVLMTAAVGVLVAALAAPAIAADLPDPPPIVYPPLPEAMGGAFYVRADAGYAFHRSPDASLSWPAGGYAVPGAGEFVDETLAGAARIGVGLGYDFGRLRSDVTLDRAGPAAFDGELACVDCDPAGQAFAETAAIAAWTILANAYVDFGDGPVTPYLGAGIGLAAVRTADMAFVNPDLAPGIWRGTTSWNFAWAVMAGISADLSDRIALDLSYRFLHLGDGTAIPADSPDGAPPVVFAGLGAHELRLGLRFSLH